VTHHALVAGARTTSGLGGLFNSLSYTELRLLLIGITLIGLVLVVFGVRGLLRARRRTALRGRPSYPAATYGRPRSGP